MNKIKTKYLIFALAVLTGIKCFPQTGEGELVPVKDIIPNIVIDLKYATTDNFFEQKLYTKNECYMLRGLVDRLKIIQDSLNNIRSYNGKSFPEGIGLKIWDGYRPRSVQFIMFEIFPDPTFVADPKSGSTHNRGGAVDLTLVNMASGEELPMPTGFDDFSDKASHSYPDEFLPPEIASNRRFLKSIMENVGGLVPYNAEWWHYSIANNKDYPLLDFQIK